ncbi:hypothetical protein CWS35_10175 [Bradyrhizobium sp. SK17]|uniref:hypothetical protein n=1 Tax=Bradyrhizobium sp. SK17 TaxID=2057741 RepID=UPI000C30E73D|nr:hypothetical protein [Bradyrhizobium sp. SK17]AUC94590.1 hypothetical protein CWS35_10175 [Bradyrhizobium sp. SK17]
MIFRPNPAFDRFTAEGALVGRMLSSFGEIEVSLCRNAAQATLLGDTLMKALYAIRTTSTRIETAHRLMQPYFKQHGILDDYQNTMDTVWHCLKIRNQYAHCNWGDNLTAGLFFADLQVSADSDNFSHTWRHVDVPLLEQQFTYFGWTMEMIEFTHHEMGVKMGHIQSHVWPRPKVPAPAPLHNPPYEHVPPWLSEDEKALHLARALASQGGPRHRHPDNRLSTRLGRRNTPDRKSSAERAERGSRTQKDVLIHLRNNSGRASPSRIDRGGSHLNTMHLLCHGYNVQQNACFCVLNWTRLKTCIIVHEVNTNHHNEQQVGVAHGW